jgi:hypothetical protein
MTEAADRAPDWRIWKHVPKAKLYDCVALSLNIDPRKLRHDSQAWMTGGPGRPAVPVFLEAQPFQDLWFLARESLGSTLAGPINWREYQRGATPEVKLAIFAKWARSVVEWEMPAELLQLAGDAALSGAAADTAVAQAYRTGLPGKPTSWRLIAGECRRRYTKGERYPTRAAWARILIDWLGSEHPSAPLPTPKTLASNKLPALLRELEASARQ